MTDSPESEGLPEAQYEMNFDLEDCDKILRVDGKKDAVNPQAFIELVKHFKCEIKVLPDEFTHA